ncbi:MAG TPA: L-aspartate oxidase [Longimicrobiales bacterium]|nr:L-aspartate oxidase [Longimicrobiales bacterium]
MSPRQHFDVLVIGSGIAGLSYALRAAEHGTVAVITKKERAESSTNYAQGGIAAVMADDDSVALHVRDTLLAGGGLCHLHAVTELAREGAARVRDLMDWGVRFTRGETGLSLGREGGHSRRRVVHAGDLTGREIERALLAAVAAHDRVHVFEDHIAIDLLVVRERATDLRRCGGALVLDHRTSELLPTHAAVTLLATGGLGQAYRHTTNPVIATGDGIAMAYRAGVQVANLEFVQFHPTALYPAEARAFLISEAVRGEGALLRTTAGELLAIDHPLGPLAPRDVVARHIDLHLKQSGDPYVLLDLAPLGAAQVEQRFPGIMAECAARGLDIRAEPIPVVPAAHYACGGIRTDHWGRTSLPGLFAAGEVACTGVHGANRLASNSLLEAVVYSHRASEQLPLELRRARVPVTEAPAAAGDGNAAPRPEALAELRRELREVMWQDVGIVRSDARLEDAAARATDLRQTAEALGALAALDPDAIELRNLIQVAELVIRCARLRRESRGLHNNVDYPYRDNERSLRDTILVAEGVGA